MIIKCNIKIEKKIILSVTRKREGENIHHCYFMPLNSVVFLACIFSLSVLSLWAFLICVFFRVYPKYLSVSWPTGLFTSVCSVEITDCFLTLFISVLLECNWKLAKKECLRGEEGKWSEETLSERNEHTYNLSQRFKNHCLWVSTVVT